MNLFYPKNNTLQDHFCGMHLLGRNCHEKNYLMRRSFPMKRLHHGKGPSSEINFMIILLKIS